MKKGFTLIEVVIAAALLVLTMGALMGAVIMARRGAVAADYQARATHAARQQMERLFALGIDDVSLACTTTSHKFTNSGFVGFYNVATNTHADLGPGLAKDINVTVVWTNPRTARSAQLTLNATMSRALHP